MLNLEQLQCFVVVAEESTIARAAEILHMAPSPLSRRVRALERTLGFPLFDRRRRRLTLTPAGTEFLEEARGLLRHAERVATSRLSTSRPGRIEVGHVAGLTSTPWLRPAVRAFLAAVPSYSITLDDRRRSGELLAAVEDRDVDVALTHRPPPDGMRVESRVVDDEAMCLALPEGHPALAGNRRGPLTAEALDAAHPDGVPFVVLPASASASGHDELLDALQRVELHPVIRAEAGDPRTVLDLVEDGVGLALVRAGSTVARQALVERPLHGLELRSRVHCVTAIGARREVERFISLLPRAGGTSAAPAATA